MLDTVAVSLAAREHRVTRLAAAGAEADQAALDARLELVGGDASSVDLTGPAVPDGLAIKIYPCCYALQRPISAISELGSKGLDRRAHV